jgi:hypothetical protein
MAKIKIETSEVVDKPLEKVSTINNDGFEKGKQVESKDYFAFMAKQRAKK